MARRGFVLASISLLLLGGCQPVMVKRMGNGPALPMGDGDRVR